MRLGPGYVEFSGFILMKRHLCSKIVGFLVYLNFPTSSSGSELLMYIPKGLIFFFFMTLPIPFIYFWYSVSLDEKIKIIYFTFTSSVYIHAVLISRSVGKPNTFSFPMELYPQLF